MLRKSTVIVGALLSSCVFAQTSGDLSKLSLDELLNLKVSVAETSGEEEITKTPAIVSRYDINDMEGVGIRSLKDVLDFIPGIDIKKSIFGQHVVSIRGVYDNFNQKILFLLDGIPYYMYSHSMTPLMGIPTEGISHVEVIRGPGAVIYGTNASAGVINVVTKKSGKSELAISTTNKDLTKIGVFFVKEFSENKKFYLSAEATTDDQFESYFDSGATVAGDPTGDVTFGNKVKSIAGGVKWENTNVSFSAFEVDNYGVAVRSAVENNSVLKESSYFLQVDHTFNLKEAKLKTYLDYNNYTPEFKVNNITIPPFGLSGDRVSISFDGDTNKRLRAGATLEKPIGDNASFLVGIEHENRNNSDYNFRYMDGTKIALASSRSTINEFSAFTQGDMNIGKYRFLAGFRYTDHEEAGTDISPRASVVYNFDKDSSLKLLYSQGFSSPNALQKHVNSATIAGNEELKPEKIETIDLAYSVKGKNSLFVANAFKTKLSDGILRTSNPSGESSLIYLNQTEFERYGLELDYQKFFSKVKIFTNYTYLHKANEVWEDDSKNAVSPKFMASAGASYSLTESHLLGFNLNYKSERTVEGGGKEVSENYIIDLNYEYKLKDHTFFASIYNLTNQEVRDPGVGSTAETMVTYDSQPKSMLEVGFKTLF